MVLGRGNKEDGKRCCIITRVTLMGKILEKYNVFEKLEKRNMENDKIL